MEELESQIAKIQLGNFKHTNSFVYIVAEKALGGEAEIYMVAELPLFNPAAEEACQKICLAIASTLKRVYKKPADSSSFENAISQINEELGKLASMGQTHWINKLNCTIAVKDRTNFTIATCGKVAAYLLRNNELTDISCSETQSHPLKTFENYASGKIKLHDLTILSTTQLFNYLSLDRVRDILQSSNFLSATQTIIELLKANAGPEVAFGTLLNYQVPIGETENEEIDLENYNLEQPEPSFFSKAFVYLKSAFVLDKTKRVPKVDLPRVSISDRINKLRGNTKTLVTKGKGVIGALSRGAAASKNTLDIQNFKNFSPQKKFFFISASVLLLAVVLNIFVTVHIKKNKQAQAKINTALQETQVLLSNAQTSLLYNDQTKAMDYYTKAQAAQPPSQKFTTAQTEAYNKNQEQIQALRQKFEKVTEVTATSVGNLGSSGNLIKLPGYLATQINGKIVSFNKETGLIQDGVLNSSETILANAITKNNAVIYNGTSLFVWDTKTGNLGPAFSSSVPSKDSFVGLQFYPTNSRVYTINKSTNQVLSFLINSNTLSRPVVAIQNFGDFSNAQDFAIDGSIYILKDKTVIKFNGGQPAEFTMPFLFTPLSGSGKIYTAVDFKYVYILDIGNNRILVLDKKGNLINTLTSKDFTKLVDFDVDEKNKIMYVLNNSDLLKVTLP